MVKNIQQYEWRVPYDSLSGFLDAVEFLPRSFGTWDKTDTGKTGEYTISDYELICILEGFSDLSKNGKIHRAQKGDLLLLEPFAVYSADCSESERFRYIYLHFDVRPYYMEQEFQALLGDEKGFIRHYDWNGKIAAMLESLVWQREVPPPGFSRMVQMALVHALIRIMQDSAKDWQATYQRLQHNTQQMDLISQAIDRVRKQISQPVRVHELAEALGASESTLNRAFNQVLGCSPGRYFMKMKVRQADEWLLTTDRTVEDIASSLGFSSLFHLSRAYKELFGVSPTQARKNRRSRMI